MSETTINLSPSVTQGRITLWVEDALTKAYLSTAWAPEDTLFDISMAGSHHTVIGLVHDARLKGIASTFGLVDRDFRSTNRPNWANTSRKIETFRLDSHEAENFLLHWEAMAGCRENQKFFNRSLQSIEARAQQIAAGMVWYMACRKVLVDNQHTIDDGYPRHPPPTDVNSLQDALDFITSRPWYQSIRQRAHHVSDSAQIQTALQDAYTQYDADLDSGAWRRTFSGKEIFTELKGWMTNYRNVTATEQNINLAISIAEWQQNNSRVPLEAIELKSAMRTRVGI